MKIEKKILQLKIKARVGVFIGLVGFISSVIAILEWNKTASIPKLKYDLHELDMAKKKQFSCDLTNYIDDVVYLDLEFFDEVSSDVYDEMNPHNQPNWISIAGANEFKNSGGGNLEFSIYCIDFNYTVRLNFSELGKSKHTRTQAVMFDTPWASLKGYFLIEHSLYPTSTYVMMRVREVQKP